MFVDLFAAVTFISAIVLFFKAFIATADHFYEERKWGMVFGAAACLVFFSLFIISFTHLYHAPLLNAYGVFGALIATILVVLVVGKSMTKLNKLIVVAKEKSL